MSVSRTPLTRERIVENAIDLIEREGEEALTMRRLGATLGVKAMSLYHHVANRDELVDAIAAKTFESMRDLDLDTDWREALARFATALRQLAVEQPRTFRLVGLLPHEAPLAVSERLLEILVDAGFRPEDALALYRAASSYARGYGLGEANGFMVDATTPAARAVLKSLPRDQFPLLRDKAREFGKLDTDSAFIAGLGALLDGFAASVLRQA